MRPVGPRAGQWRRFVHRGRKQQPRTQVNHSADHRPRCRHCPRRAGFCAYRPDHRPGGAEYARPDSPRSGERRDRGRRQREQPRAGMASRVDVHQRCAGRPRDRTGGFLLGPGQSNGQLAVGQHAMGALPGLRSIPTAISTSRTPTTAASSNTTRRSLPAREFFHASAARRT